MAKLVTTTLIFFISSLLVLTPKSYARKLGPNAGAGDENSIIQYISQGKENVFKLEVYLHDLRVGNANPTVYTVATASITSNSNTSFGTVNAVDDLLTVTSDINSTPIGRIQGLTTSADLYVNGVALNLNIVFTAGRFNGSTISIVGRNPIANAQRELTVAGGTGAFRFARGYAVQTTSLYDAASFYGVFKFTIYLTLSAFREVDAVMISAI